MLRRPPRSTRTDTLVPYTTLFRSLGDRGAAVELARRAQGRARDLPSDLPAAPFEPAREIAQQSRVQPGTGEGIENGALPSDMRSEEHTSELQSLMRISYAVFCLNNKKRDSSLRCNQDAHTDI